MATSVEENVVDEKSSDQEVEPSEEPTSFKALVCNIMLVDAWLNMTDCGFLVEGYISMIYMRLTLMVGCLFISIQGVVDVLCEACELLKWKNPTKIQRESIPVALESKLNMFVVLITNMCD